MHMLTDAKISRTPIAVVGNINLDIKTSLLCASPRLFEDGETSVQEIYESLGGGATNVAVAAAQLGGRVHFCGCIGADELGDRLERALTAFGVTSHLRRKQTATGRSINLNWTNHRRHFVSSLPNNRVLTPDDVDIPRLAQLGCGKLYRGDIWFSEPMLREGNAIVLKEARDMGMTTLVDINWDPEWSVAHNDSNVRARISHVFRIMRHVSCVQCNETELARFTGMPSARDSCSFLRDHGCGEVVVHRGEEGVAAFTAQGDWVEAPASAVSEVVSETGAGDVFSAAFMLLSEVPLKERLSLCCRVAAEHLQGSMVLLPRLDSARLNRQPSKSDRRLRRRMTRQQRVEACPG